MFGFTKSSALVGGAAWVGLAAAAAAGRVSLGTIEQLFLLAPLVIVPLGLGVAATPDGVGVYRFLYRAACFLQPLGAALVVASFWFRPGAPAGLLASGWLVVCGFLGLCGLLRFLRTGLARSEEACFAAGLLYLPIGGAWLVASRLGETPLGFQEPIVLLTAVHFHYTGFAAPLLAGAAGRALLGSSSSPLGRAWFGLVAVGVIAGTPLLAAGFVVSPMLKVLSALLLAASLLALSALVIGLLPTIQHRPAQVGLAVSAGSLIVGMLLAGVYAVGEFNGRLLISIPQMAAAHGVANGLGFALCGLLAWTLVHSESPSWR